jgi:hypothetical protein
VSCNASIVAIRAASVHERGGVFFNSLLAAESLEEIARHAPDATVLPEALKKQIAKDLKEHPHQLAIWQIADGGWRPFLQARLASLQEARNKRLNAPRSVNINELFQSSIGLPNISSSWKWKSMTAAKSSAKLDELVELRGAIAHRGNAGKSCTKKLVISYLSHVQMLVPKTFGKVKEFTEPITGRPFG